VNISLCVRSTAFSEEMNPLNPPCMIFFLIIKFFNLDDAAYNLNKMMINSLFIVYDNVSYFY
jgi:hypothetical protein